MEETIQNLYELVEKLQSRIEDLEKDVTKLKDQQWKYCASLQIKDYRR